MNNQNERVVPLSKHNCYKYYDTRKHHYKENYLEKKRRDAIAEEHKDYYKDYFLQKLWIPENLEEYIKNKINNNINNETNISKTQ